MELENQDSTSSKINITHDTTVIEEKVSEIDVKDKQKRQSLEQQKSILVTHDMLHVSSKVSNHAAE